MLKILVPTDFSDNSKTGMRFAIQWSIQQRVELIFFHVFNVALLQPGKDSKEYTEPVDANAISKLKSFVSDLYKSTNTKPGKHSFVAKQGISPDMSMIEYCRQHADISYICIATRGAGKLNKLFGTNTGNLITKSPIPVIAVPRNYRAKPVKRILFAADFQDYPLELEKVERFTRPFKANLEVLHLAWPGEVLPSQKMLEKSSGRKSPFKISMNILSRDFNKSLLKNLQDRFNKSKPSLIVMFTNQYRSLLDRILSSSITEQVSFTTKTPMLAFHKS